jgi:hypothetical protein
MRHRGTFDILPVFTQCKKAPSAEDSSVREILFQQLVRGNFGKKIFVDALQHIDDVRRYKLYHLPWP